MVLAIDVPEPASAVIQDGQAQDIGGSGSGDADASLPAPPAEGDEAPADASDAPAANDASSDEPQLSAEASRQVEAQAGGISLLSVPAGTHWMPDPGRAYVEFTVKDTQGNPTGGSTVNFQGPRTGSSTISWGASLAVTDCTTGVNPCPNNSYDQDSRPGYFAIDRVQNQVAVRNTGRYRVGASATAPSGYAWTTEALTNTNESNATNQTVTGRTAGTANSPANGQWQGTTNSVNVITGPVLRSFAPLCEVDYFYGLTNAGQIIQVAPNGSPSTGGVATNLGTSTGAGSAMNGLGVAIDAAGVHQVFAYNTSTANSNTTATVYRYSAATGTWSSTGKSFTFDSGHVIAGVVSPDGKTFYMGGFQSAGTNRKFGLWAYDISTGVISSKGVVDPGSGNYSSSTQNGDLTFDSSGNLYVVRGVGTALTVFQVSAGQLAAAGSSSNIVPTNVWKPTNTQTDINGVAYSASGELFVGSGTSVSKVNVSGTSGSTSYPVSPSGTFSDSVDLASCSMPPTVKLIKNLPDGRSAPGDQFGLKIKAGATDLSSALTTGAAAGVQPQQAGPVPIVAGTTVTIEESFQNGALAANYASGYICTVPGESTPIARNSGSSGSFVVPVSALGQEITCEFKNSIVQAKKSATPASGTAVNENGVVEYTLSFDNSQGLGPATVNYRDFLADVLDDAYFVDSSGAATAPQAPHVTVTNGMLYAASDWNSTNRWLNVRGTVPAGQVGTLKFPVKVFANTRDAESRQRATGTDGYLLRNKLVRGTPTTPPAACDVGMCTEHPINAWTFEKSSLPADGASLHKGGNAHYRLTATKTHATADIKTVTFTDDLTHVFKTAGWAPNAAVPGGALSRGVYFFDKNGKTLDQAGVITTAQPAPAYTANTVGSPVLGADGRWILSATVTMPSNAMRAELWFAVQAGESPAGIPAVLGVQDGAPPQPISAPSSGWAFVNYATATATTSNGTLFAASQCDTQQGIIGNWWPADTGTDPRSGTGVADATVPDACRTLHNLDASYFTIRKDAAGAGMSLPSIPAYGSDTTGLWNMIGHEFEIRDNVGGAPTAYQSRYLCRTAYNPGAPGGASTWNGVFITGGTLDSGRNSATLAAIKAWNNAQTDPAKYVPECAVAYPQVAAGGQTGRWKVENLPEAAKTFAGTSNPAATGDYWLIETKAPDRQISLNGELTRPVPGVQLLAEPVPFKVWPMSDGNTWPPVAGQDANEQARAGRGQLDVATNGGFGAGPPVVGNYLERCLPGGTVGSRPTACVNPTGYLMIVKDPVPTPLPLTGGMGLGILTASGILLITASTIGALWWRRRQPNQTSAE